MSSWVLDQLVTCGQCWCLHLPLFTAFLCIPGYQEHLDLCREGLGRWRGLSRGHVPTLTPAASKSQLPLTDNALWSPAEAHGHHSCNPVFPHPFPSWPHVSWAAKVQSLGRTCARLAGSAVLAAAQSSLALLCQPSFLFLQ